MTIDEAIEVMNNEQRCVIRNIGKRCDRNCSTCDLVLPDTEVLSAYGVAINALQEIQCAEAGCKYCRNGEIIAWDMCNDAVSIDTDGKIHILEAGDWECEINYCPMCGRKLRRPPVKEET